jgi:hypothetical protein
MPTHIAICVMGATTVLYIYLDTLPSVTALVSFFYLFHISLKTQVSEEKLENDQRETRTKKKQND